MWQIENTTPFEAAGNWARDRDGSEVWLVAVRCAFDVRHDGSTSVSAVQEEPVLAPTFAGDPAHSSMTSDSDFHLTKPSTDILLHGHAYAPGGHAAQVVDVTLKIGAITKTLRVYGDRVYKRQVTGIVPSGPEPFDRMPIVYERAYGGREPDSEGRADFVRQEPRNPVGRGFEPRPGLLAPNVEYRDGARRNCPAGFGPIAAHWAPRLERAGTYDEQWRRQKMPLYPDDLDDRFFLCSPDDQRPSGHLYGADRVELTNLTPEGLMTFSLPRLAFRFESELRGKPSVLHRGFLHTVNLLPDQRRVIMVWQSALRIHADVHRLLRTHVRQLNVINARASAGAAAVAIDDDE